MSRAPTGFDVLTGRAPDQNTLPDTLTSEQFSALPLPDKLREVDLTLRPDRERAVDALEIAAYLEADGLNDEGLRDRYGAGGLFAAAEWLYAQRGTGRALERARQEAPPRFPWHLAQRGPLYLLPGACGLLLGSALGRGAGVAFVFAAAFGWGYSMLIATVRYAEPFGTPGRALRLTLLLGTACGLLGGGVLGALFAGAPWTGGLLWGLVLGGTVTLAGTSAGVLLALDQRGQVAGAFALPLLLGGMVYVWPQPGLVAAALLALAVCPLLLALRATRNPGDLPARLSTLRPGLPLAAYGWALAVAFVCLSARLGGWALLPVVVSAGLLEAGVWHAQQGLQHAARRPGNFGLLVRRGSAAVMGNALAYGLTLLGGLALLELWPVPGWQRGPNSLLTVPLFGAALLLSTWLANQRHERLLVAGWLGFSALLLLGVSPPTLSVLSVLVLLPLTFVTLRDLRSYR